MPHCGESLYNNIIAKNWTCLENVFVFGNSFKFYFDSLKEDVFKLKAPSVLYCIEIMEEVAYCVEENDTAFNNSSLIYFPKDKRKVEDSYWKNAPLLLIN